ncbi:hypothetical protein ACJX0J_005721 [Zea mays]
MNIHIIKGIWSHNIATALNNIDISSDGICFNNYAIYAFHQESHNSQIIILYTALCKTEKVYAAAKDDYMTLSTKYTLIIYSLLMSNLARRIMQMNHRLVTACTSIQFTWTTITTLEHLHLHLLDRFLNLIPNSYIVPRPEKHNNRVGGKNPVFQYTLNLATLFRAKLIFTKGNAMNIYLLSLCIDQNECFEESIGLLVTIRVQYLLDDLISCLSELGEHLARGDYDAEEA